MCLFHILEQEDELFRSPAVEYSSSSSDEDDEIDCTFDKESFLPSIGPPKILQYIKESVNPPFTNEFPGSEAGDVRSDGAKGDHSCAYCKAEVLNKVDVGQHVSLAEAVSLLENIFLLSTGNPNIIF